MSLRVFLVQLALVTVPASVIFEDCGSSYELHEVDIEGCGWSLPCYVTAGEEVPVDIKFYADFSSLSLDQNVVIRINLVNLNTDVTPGSSYELHEVDIEGCGWSLPCYVTAGEEVPVDIKFYADFSSLSLDQNVVIRINLVNLNTDVTPDPCKTVDCPVRTNAVNSYTSMMKVPSRMALNQRGYLRWHVYNEKHQLVLCYSVLVHTQSPLQKKLRQVLTAITPEHANVLVDSLDWDSPEPNINEDYLQKLVSLYYDNQKLVIRSSSKETLDKN